MHAGFCHFTRVRVNKHIPPFTGGGFLTFSPSPGFICCVSNCLGNASLSPPRLASNGSIPLRSTTIHFCFHGNFPFTTSNRYSRLSMKWVLWHFTISKSNDELSRVHDTEWSSLVARRVHSPKVGGSNPSSVSISDLLQSGQSWLLTPDKSEPSMTGSANSFPVASDRSVLNSLFPEIQRKECSC